MASGLGVEPRLTGPEPVVLPLDDPEIIYTYLIYIIYYIITLNLNSKEWKCYNINILK